MINIFLISLLLMIQSTSTCSFDSSQQSPTFESQHSIRHLSVRDSNFLPLRLTVIFVHIDLDPSLIPSFKNDLVNGALTFYQNALRVRRLASNLIFPGLSETYCGTHFINSTEAIIGYSNTDMLIYIEASSSTSSNSGYSKICAQDAYMNYPIVGFIHIETKSYSSLSYESIYASLMHQIAHLLAFNEFYFDMFINPDGEQYEYSDVVKSGYERNHTVYKIKTPIVLQKARAAFACPTLDGVELATTGVDGLPVSHWNKRILNDEFMVADASSIDTIYSDITLALFEDSGWYKVNYTYTSQIIWGSQSQCPFLSQPCVSNGVPTSLFFNVDVFNQRCDYKRLNKGQTNLRTYNYSIAAEFQYFNSSFYGGDQYADYCPFIAANNDGNCRGLGSVATSVNSDYGESIGYNSRCVEGNYTLNENIVWHAACHIVECFDGYVNIHVGTEVVSCPFAGGFIQVPGYNGYLNCYDSAQLCVVKPCPNACSGLGLCVNGVCECFNSNFTDDCREYTNQGQNNGAGTLLKLGLGILGVLV